MANETRLAAAMAVNSHKKEVKAKISEAIAPVVHEIVTEYGGDGQVVKDLMTFLERGVNRATKRLIKEYDGSMDNEESE